MKTKKLKKLPAFLFLFSLCISLLGIECKKEEPDVQGADGLVLYYGDPAVDGCGWIIKINNTEYAPVNLDSEFQNDSTNVVLEFNLLDSKWHCGWREPGYQQIEITKISIKK
jgi:hypothetical protein